MTQSPASPAGGDADIAAVGSLFADPARTRILLALTDGRSLPAGRLAQEAGISAATAERRLRKLTDAGLLDVEYYGRHRYYRVAGPQVAVVIEALRQLAPVGPIRSLRQGTRAQALRAARTCYDHLAGRLGVQLMTALIEAGRLTGGDGGFDPRTACCDRITGPGRDVDYHLTDAGLRFLTGFGIALPPRPPVVRYCVDWTEQRHHLAGVVGRGLLVHLLELDWIRRRPGDRAVEVTDAGRCGLSETFGVAGLREA